MAGSCGHHHHASASASGQNKDYFDKQAASYDTKHEKTLDRVIEEIRARLDFIGVDWVDDDDSDHDGKDGRERAQQKSVRLLDYACGTGTVSRALAHYTTQCVGIDLSENMVAAYNARAANQGLTPSEMYAHQGNICTADDDDATAAAFASPEFSGFDVAAVGLGFHHFDDPALAARKLAARLKVGGVLVIIDFLPHGKPDPAHAATSTVTHHGFSEAQMRRIYDQAGVGNDFALEEVANVVFNTHTHTHADSEHTHTGSEHTHTHGGSEHTHTHTGSEHTHTHTGSEHTPHAGSEPSSGHEPEMRRTIFIARGVKA